MLAAAVRMDAKTGAISWSAKFSKPGGYFSSINGILEDYWGGGNFIAVEPHTIVASKPTIITVLKVDINDTIGPPPTAITWASYELACDATCTLYGDPVTLYLPEYTQYYLAFAFRSKIGI